MGMIRDHGDGKVSFATYDALPPRARRLIQRHGRLAERALRNCSTVEEALAWMRAKKAMSEQRRDAAHAPTVRT